MKYTFIVIILTISIFASACAKQSGKADRNIEASRCCSECRDAWAKSPAAIGAEGAVCGRFMTAAAMSDACRHYFEKDPMTVSACEKFADTK